MQDMPEIAPGAGPAPQTEPAPLPEPDGPDRHRPSPALLAPPGPSRKKYLAVVFELFLVLLVPAVFTLAVGTFQAVRPPKALSARTPADLGLSYESVTLTTADGIRIAAWYVPAKKDDGRAVLVLHGYPADKGDILPRVAFLADRYSLLLVDFRYFGESSGAYTTLGVREPAEALAGIGYLKKRGARRIGIYGFSMGGAVALETLSRTSDVAAVAAEAPYADLRMISEEPYKYLGPLKPWFAAMSVRIAAALTGIDPDKESPLTAAAATSLPVLVAHAKDDPVVPFANAQALAKALAHDPVAEFWFPDRGGHGDPSTDFAATLGSFFDRNLK